MEVLESVKLDLVEKDNAPEAAKPYLEKAEQAFGLVPNLLKVMANFPPLLKTYLEGAMGLREANLTATEVEVIFLTVSRTNGCHYCMAAHSTVADMSKVPTEVTDAIRNGEPIADAKLQALRTFTEIVVEKRGFPTDEEVSAFLAAGYTQQDILAVVYGVGIKTLSNYTNHLANTPVDPAFSNRTWTA